MEKEYPFIYFQERKAILKEWVRKDPVRHELVFLVDEGGGNGLENQYRCAVSFRASDGLKHICDRVLGHDGVCWCEVHDVS